MRLSTKARYAVMAMVDVAGKNAGTETVSLTDIAKREHLPLPYLEQLFGRLRKANLVKSLRGAHGGYQLARQARTISIFDVISAVDASLKATRCAVSAGCQPDGAKCKTHDLWDELGSVVAHYLKGISLDDVCAGRVVWRCASENAHV